MIDKIPSVMVIPQDDGTSIRVTVEVVDVEEKPQYWWWHNEQTQNFWRDHGDDIVYQRLPDRVYPGATREIYRVFATKEDRVKTLDDLRVAIGRSQGMGRS